MVWSFEPLSLVRVGMGVADELQSRSYSGSDDVLALETQIRDLEYEIEQLRYQELDRWLEKNPQSPQYPIP